MRPGLPRKITRDPDSGPHRVCAGSESGMTLIEVLVCALMVALMAMAVLAGLDAMARQSGSLRTRADAQAVAQQSQNRLKGYNINELSNLNRTYTTAKLDGVQFTVHETANYVSDSTGAPSCTNPTTDYLRTISTVTWPNMGTRPPIVVTGVLTPPIASIDSAHGTLAVMVKAASGAGISGVNVSLSGTSSASGVTDSTGCALFGDVPAGAYTISAASPSINYVDMATGAVITAGAPDTQNASVIGGRTASIEFDMDVGGTINYSFQSTIVSSPIPTPGAIGVVATTT
jgi:Tfp pilus assembly protein PilV